MYILRDLYIKNFKCYRGEHTIDISKNKKSIGLVGSYIDTEGRSNWSGKSSFGDVLRYLIFGKCGIKNQNLISWGEDELEVEGTLLNVIDGEMITINRKVHSNGKTSTLIDDRDTSRRGQEWLQEKIGITYDEWLVTSFFEQDDTLRFCKMGPSEKRAEIQKWLEKTYWEKAREKAKSKLDELKKELDKQNVIIDTTEIKDKDTLLDDITLLENEIKELLEKYDKEQKLLKDKRSIEVECSCLMDSIKTNRKRLLTWMRLEDLIEKENHYKSEYELYKKLEVERESIRNKVSDQQAIVNTITKKGKELKKKLSEQFNGICPLDNKQCPRKSEIDQTEYLQEQRNELAKEYKKENALLESYKEEMRSFNEEFSKYKDAKFKLGETTKELDTLLSYEEYDSMGEIDNLDQLNHLIDAYANIDDIQSNVSYSTISYKQNRLGHLQHELESNDNNIKKKKQVEKKKKEYSKDIKIYQFLNYSFSKEGIPSAIVNMALEKIKKSANRTLKSLGTGLEIRFSTDKETKTKSNVCYTCGETFKPKKRKCHGCGSDRPYKISQDLNIEVFVNGTWGSFESQSGGCKVLVATMIRFAVSKMARESGKSKLLVGFIDEVLGSLDPVNKVALARCLITDNDLGISQRFMVTHDENIQSMFSDTLKITMNSKNGNSTIKWSE